MLFKDRLRNDNVFIWFGTFDEDQINNCLILAGGDVFILMGIQKIELNKPQIKNDLLCMSIRDFVDKYNLIDFESIDKTLKEKEIDKENYKRKVFQLIEELKEGVRAGIYPPFMTNYEQKAEEIKEIISYYLSKISNSMKPEDTVDHLEEIINNCEEKIQKIQENQMKNKRPMLKNKEKIIRSEKLNSLLKIQKEIDENVNLLKNKTRRALKKFEEFKRQLS